MAYLNNKSIIYLLNALNFAYSVDRLGTVPDLPLEEWHGLQQPPLPIEHVIFRLSIPRLPLPALVQPGVGIAVGFPPAVQVCHCGTVGLQLKKHYTQNTKEFFFLKCVFLYSTLSSPLDHTKRFTLHPWQTCSFRHQLGFSVKHSSHAAVITARRLFTHISNHCL